MPLLSLNDCLCTCFDVSLPQPGDILGRRRVPDVEDVPLGRSQHLVCVLIVYLSHLYTDNY